MLHASVTYIEKLIHLFPAFSLVPSNQYQLALKVSEVIQREVGLRQLFPCVLQLKVDHVMDAVGSLCSIGAYPITPISQDVSHLPKGGDLN